MASFDQPHLPTHRSREERWHAHEDLHKRAMRVPHETKHHAHGAALHRIMREHYETPHVADSNPGYAKRRAREHGIMEDRHMNAASQHHKGEIGYKKLETLHHIHKSAYHNAQLAHGRPGDSNFNPRRVTAGLRHFRGK